MKLQLVILVCLLVPGSVLPAQTATEEAAVGGTFDARAACEAWEEVLGLQRRKGWLPSLVGYDTCLPLLGPDLALRFSLSFSALGFEASYAQKAQAASVEVGFDPRAAYRALLELEKIELPPARPEPEVFAELYHGFHDAKVRTEFDPRAAFMALQALELVDSMGGVIPCALPRVIVISTDDQRVDLFERMYRFQLENNSRTEVRTAAVPGE